jgi:Tfp pilus assembly protein PilO
MKNPFGPQGPPGWLVTGGMASIALAYVFLAFLPSQKAMKVMRRQLNEKQNYIAESDRKFAEIATKRAELAVASQHVNRWQADGPDPKQADHLQAQVSQKASVAGVRVMKLQAQQPIAHGLVAEYPILVSVEGTFSGIFHFFHGVEELPQTVWLKDVRLLRPGELKGDLRCDLTLTILGDLAENSD